MKEPLSTFNLQLNSQEARLERGFRLQAEEQDEARVTSA
jgi:hypothetical protein